MKSPQTLLCVYIMYDKFVLGRLADTLCYSSAWIIICFSCFLIPNIWGFSWSGTSNECIMLFITIQLQHGCFFDTSFQKILFFSILIELWCTRQLPTRYQTGNCSEWFANESALFKCSWTSMHWALKQIWTRQDSWLLFPFAEKLHRLSLFHVKPQ